MKYLNFVIFIASVGLMAACGGSQYSEEEQKILLKAEEAHYKAIDAFGDSYSQLDVITALEDSIRLKISGLSASQVSADSAENVTDSIVQELTAAQENLTEAKNNLLLWSNDIYGLPDATGPYADEPSDDNAAIGKNEENNLIRSNIQFKEIPANMTPEEIQSIQEEQLNRITTIQQQIEASIENANRVLAENL